MFLYTDMYTYMYVCIVGHDIFFITPSRLQSLPISKLSSDKTVYILIYICILQTVTFFFFFFFFIISSYKRPNPGEELPMSTQWNRHDAGQGEADVTLSSSLSVYLVSFLLPYSDPSAPEGRRTKVQVLGFASLVLFPPVDVRTGISRFFFCGILILRGNRYWR